MVVKDLFSGCQFVLDLGSAAYRDKKYIRELITVNGGQISYILTNKSNYVVVCEKSLSSHFDTYKSRRATSLGIPVVSEKFVEQCLSEGTLVEHDDFIVVGDSKYDKFSKGTVTAGRTHLEKKRSQKEFKINAVRTYKLDSGDCPEFPENFQVVKFAILQNADDTGDKVSQSPSTIEVHVGSQQNLGRALRVVLYEQNPQLGGEPRGLVYHVKDSWEAARCYKSLVDRMQKRGMKRVFSLPGVEKVGSSSLRMLLDEMKSSAGKLHPEVVRLVETVWKDSLGELESILSVQPQEVTVDQARNAEITLMKIRDALNRHEPVDKFSDEFYGFLPHNSSQETLIDNVQVVTKKQELCQLLRDIMLAGEATWLSENSNNTLSQYLALNCSIMPIDPDDKEHKFVKDMISVSGNVNLTIRNVFRINRSVENADFRDDLPNARMLFHASSPHNYVGIFSRGLLLPNVVTSELGGVRSDEGNLGSGIYFSDSLMTSLKYAPPSQSRGSRLLLVSKVALGKVYETQEHMQTLTAPPDGFDSVKGVPRPGKETKDSSLGFDNNEFAVYSNNQQKMTYLVEFTVNDEELLPYSCSEISLAAPVKYCVNTETDEVNLTSAVRKVEAGLIFDNKSFSAKLEAVHVRAKVIDAVAEVIVFQSYTNNSPFPLEAKFVFPLSEDAAVSGFEAFINDKHIVGIVKEKEEAHREYKQAISEGHGAYLMDEEKPNVFTVSVGNIPPSARVVIKLTYVTELTIASGGDGCILFHLPSNISPWETKSTQLSSSVTQTTTKSITVSGNEKSSLVISVDMPFDIIDLTCPTHKIVTKKTASKACVRLSKTCTLGDDFSLLIKVAEIHVPRMWVERSKPDDMEQVAMVTFFPEFDLKEVDDFDCLVLLDMSNSMRGSPARYAKALSNLLIENLPKQSSFNVVTFGSNFEELFADTEKVTDSNMARAKNFLSLCTATRGGSDLAYLLNSVYNLCCTQERINNIFLLSDGHLSEEERLMQVAHKISDASKSQTRIFSCGVGKAVNGHVLQKLSVMTGGSYEYFDPCVKRVWKRQLQTQLLNARQPVLTNVWIDWRDYDTETKNKAIQVPEKVKCLFNGSRLIAYSSTPGCMQATLHADVCGKEFSTVVTASDLCVKTGNTLHRLAAKAMFKEYESGLLGDDAHTDQLLRENRKESIISLSIEHCVITKYTSFVAVEKREKDESETLGMRSGPTVADLIERSFVDILPEIEWTPESASVEDAIDDLLKKAYQTQSSSIIEARRSVKDAKEMYGSLEGEDLERLLLISAAEAQLGITESRPDAWNNLKAVMLENGSNLNYDFLNMACKEEKDDLRSSLLDLISHVWPDHAYVRVSSFPRGLTPLIIGAFCEINSSSSEFLDQEWMNEVFWESMDRLAASAAEPFMHPKNLSRLCRITSRLSSKFSLDFRDSEYPVRHSKVSYGYLGHDMNAERGISSARKVDSFMEGAGAFDSNLSSSGLLFGSTTKKKRLSMFSQLAKFPSGMKSGRENLDTGGEISRDKDHPVLFGGGFGFSRQSKKTVPDSIAYRTSGFTFGLPSASRSLANRDVMEKTYHTGGGGIHDVAPENVTQAPVVGGAEYCRKSFIVQTPQAPVMGGTDYIPKEFVVGTAPAGMARSFAFGLVGTGKSKDEGHVVRRSQPVLSRTHLTGGGGIHDVAPQEVTEGLIEDASIHDMALEDLMCQAHLPSPPNQVSTMAQAPFSFQSSGTAINASLYSFGSAAEDEMHHASQRIYLTGGAGIHEKAPETMAQASTSTYDDLSTSEDEERDGSYSVSGSLCTPGRLDYYMCVNSELEDSDAYESISSEQTADEMHDGDFILNDLDPNIIKLLEKLNEDGDLIDLVIRMMNLEGFWSFPDLSRLSDFASGCFAMGRQVIIEAGGSSFGSKVLSRILDMFLTAVVVELLKLCCFPKYRSLAQYGADWLKASDLACPFLYSRLELGRSWSEAARTIVARVAIDAFEIRRSQL